MSQIEVMGVVIMRNHALRVAQGRATQPILPDVSLYDWVLKLNLPEGIIIVTE